MRPDAARRCSRRSPRLPETAALCLAVVAVLLLAAPVAALGQRVTVLVTPFENQTADRNIDWLGEGLAVLVGERLNSESSLYVFGRDERVAAYERAGIPAAAGVSRATVMKLAWDIGADIVVTGRLYGDAANFKTEARILDVARTVAHPAETAEGKLDEVMSIAGDLAAGIASVLAPGSRPPESDYTLRPPVPRSAFEAYVRGLLTLDPQRSFELFKDAVRLHPQYASATYQLGRAAYLDADYESAVALLEKIPPGSSEYAYARFTLAVSCYETGAYDKAAAILEELPPVYDVLVNQGAALAAKGDAAGARSAWTRAVERDSLGSEAAFNLAHLAYATGNADAARKRLEEFLLLYGRDAEAFFTLGRALEQMRLDNEAQRAMAQALRLSPRLERWLDEPLPNLTRLRTQFNPTEIRLAADGSIWTQARLSRRAAGQDPAAWLDSVREQIDSQLFSETIRELRDMARTFPDSPDVHLLLGYVYERRGQYDLARSEYRRSLDLKPSVEGYLTLARLYRARNQIPLALAAVDDALRLEPGNGIAQGLRGELQTPGAASRGRRP
jgi:tetratricopeptide (TPR) repeat protein